jgi:hypothetical protein
MEYQVTAGHFLTSQMWYSTQIKKNHQASCESNVEK